MITAIIGGFIVSFLGGSSVQIGGPTGAFIVIVFGIIQTFGIEGLVIATFIAGLILVLMGLFHLGTVIRFIPYPIVVGFTSGIALTIFTTQMKDLFGLTMEKVPADFISKWIAYIQHFDTINPWATAVGVISIALIAITPKISKRVPGSLVAIIVMTVVVYILKNHFGITGIETIGDRFEINASLPDPEPVKFNIETINLLLPSAFTIAILGAIESLLSATVADGVIGERHNSNTELMAQGAANIIVPLFGGIPVTGAIARTMTNINNGGRTPIAGIIHAVVLLLILLFLGPLTKHIPHGLPGRRAGGSLLQHERMANLPIVVEKPQIGRNRTAHHPLPDGHLQPDHRHRNRVTAGHPCCSCTVSWKQPTSRYCVTNSIWTKANDQKTTNEKLNIAPGGRGLRNRRPVLLRHRQQIRRTDEKHRRQTLDPYHPDAESSLYRLYRAAQLRDIFPFFPTRGNTYHPLRGDSLGTSHAPQGRTRQIHRRREYFRPHQRSRCQSQ